MACVKKKNIKGKWIGSEYLVWNAFVSFSYSNSFIFYNRELPAFYCTLCTVNFPHKCSIHRIHINNKWTNFRSKDEKKMHIPFNSIRFKFNSEFAMQSCDDHTNSVAIHYDVEHICSMLKTFLSLLFVVTKSIQIRKNKLITFFLPHSYVIVIHISGICMYLLRKHSKSWLHSHLRNLIIIKLDLWKQKDERGT